MEMFLAELPLMSNCSHLSEGGWHIGDPGVCEGGDQISVALHRKVHSGFFNSGWSPVRPVLPWDCYLTESVISLKFHSSGWASFKALTDTMKHEAHGNPRPSGLSECKAEMNKGSSRGWREPEGAEAYLVFLF